MASIKLNYPDMLQQIKLSIFTGDHSAIYSMACAVACIAASFSLITWYNKMLNDPYGRLDMRAVVRTLIVLFLTCNFYSFVLVPFDSITHTVTKAISASVDKDPSGLWGKVNDVYSSIEDKTKEETLVKTTSPTPPWTPFPMRRRPWLSPWPKPPFRRERSRDSSSGSGPA